MIEFQVLFLYPPFGFKLFQTFIVFSHSNKEFADYGPDFVSFNDGNLDGGFRKETSVQRGGLLVVIYTTELETVEAEIKKKPEGQSW